MYYVNYVLLDSVLATTMIRLLSTVVCRGAQIWHVAQRARIAGRENVRKPCEEGYTKDHVCVCVVCCNHDDDDDDDDNDDYTRTE